MWTFSLIISMFVFGHICDAFSRSSKTSSISSRLFSSYQGKPRNLNSAWIKKGPTESSVNKDSSPQTSRRFEKYSPNKDESANRWTPKSTTREERVTREESPPTFRSNTQIKNEFYSKLKKQRDNGIETENNYLERDYEPAYGNYEGDHIYGANPVKLALLSGKRKFKELLVQSASESSNARKEQEISAEIMDLCQRLGIPVRSFPKHDLNMITDSRPHQGFVLRATPRDFVSIESLPPETSFK